jgi:hypothetical protein
MTTQENLVNVDLDVLKVCKNIPRDDKNAYMYLRMYIGNNIDENLAGCGHVEGDNDLVVCMLASLMVEHRELINTFKQAIKLAEGVPIEKVLG